ncbi:MAG: RNA-binding domain-containing protein [Nocardioides sp.]
MLPEHVTAHGAFCKDRWLVAGVVVRQRVSGLRQNRKAEDDRVEFKSDWPEPHKAARQLAASANRQAGEFLVYVVGIDDQTGALTDVSNTEAGDWVTQVAKSFDQGIVPTLVRHQVVAVSDDETVNVLLFSTNEYPYVVKTADGNRDVPFRSGSTTRSAHRHELVDMLQRELDLPRMRVVAASTSAAYSFRPRKSATTTANDELVADESFSIHAEVTVLVEYVGDGAVTMPERQLRMRIRTGGYLQYLEPRLHTGQRGVGFIRIGEAAPEPPPPPRFGVYVRDGQVVATAPGTFTMGASNSIKRQYPAPQVGELAELFTTADKVALDIVVEVTGAVRQARLTVELERTEAAGEAKPEPWEHDKATTQSLGTWALVSRFDDPWAEDDD